MKIGKVVFNGGKNGATVIWELAKVIIPIITLVNFLERAGFLEHIAEFLQPAMGIFSLPGEGALVLIIGNLTTVYGAVAAMMTLDLTVKEITILSTMIAICHSMLSETVIARKVGAKWYVVLGFRVSMSLIVGVILGIIL
ncbi:nucleoside recognition protein [Alkalicella caledoniensis]|uniref:Nucleoside recognition protein n=1 Tax=Alkalicella caledoniensis TaxID=2731377 RepID=A0A7G9WCB2_ALKCA|nr:nucleoside recognition domain-containing protein [Alkalicella caledoniensis]QNO16324.1 nucleoside recognition protein [Alkalicella caledoniensis]